MFQLFPLSTTTETQWSNIPGLQQLQLKGEELNRLQMMRHGSIPTYKSDKYAIQLPLGICWTFQNMKENPPKSFRGQSSAALMNETLILM